jgi:FHA domain-containing protein/uncharacterized protein DUF1707
VNDGAGDVRWVRTSSRGKIGGMGMPASAPATMRASAAERDRVVGRLQDARAEDRLSLHTFVERLDLLYAARTHDELHALVADLPQPRTLDRFLARVADVAAESVTRCTDAWGRATAPRLTLPTRGTVVLGRARDCQCVISDATVSRHHAMLVQTQAGWELRDLASCNGTYVNGARVTDAAPVRPGDDVWIGCARFRLVQPRPPAH